MDGWMLERVDGCLGECRIYYISITTYFWEAVHILSFVTQILWVAHGIFPPSFCSIEKQY